jgi:hypothetical protein
MGNNQSSVTGMTISSSKLIRVPTKDRNSALTGNASKDAATPSTIKNTFAQDAEIPLMVPTAVLLSSKPSISTPLQADK